MPNENQTDKSLFRHADTNEIFAIERTWNGDIVGSAGPLSEPLKEPSEYKYSPDRNDSIRSQGDKLILLF